MVDDAATAAKAARLPRVLIAHDDAELRAQAADALAPKYRTVAAAGASDALAEAATERPDLILCGEGLAVSDSRPLWRAFRDDPALADIPLVLVLDRGGGEAAAALDDVIYCPFSAAELRARVAFAIQFARQRQEAAAIKAESEAMLQRIGTVLTHLPFGLTMVNPEGQIVYANPARERLLRFDGQPKIGEKLAPQLPAQRGDGSVLAPDEYPIRRALRGEFVTDLEIRYDSGDGEPHWLRASGIPVNKPDGTVQYAIGVAIDITGEMRARLELLKLTESLEERVRTEIDERLKAEETLRQVQKMQTIGQLTGGVAHDFNNLLQVMMGNLEAIERQVRGDTPYDRARMERQIDAALRGAARAAQMTQQLLAFSRRQPLQPAPLDANELARRMTELFRRTLGENIAIETALEPALRSAYADPNQLEAALLNLAVNARDAMASGGKLTIETANVSFEGTMAAPWDEFAPGDYVMIAVSDTGSGIPAEIMPHIFEPFFTTKEIGRGTGLGLSQAYGFAKQSGGHIKIYSEVGVGTTVKLYLPAGQATGPADRRAAAPAARGSVHGEIVLVVEDDPDVRAFSAETLREFGYDVIEAGSGVEALQRLEENPAVRLMFTDVGLPGGMTGRELADVARVRWPKLKVLFTTGYARNAIVHHGRLDPGVELIAKPFTASGLATRIRGMLDAD
jgi:PAS domain S-box-containing protein